MNIIYHKVFITLLAYLLGSIPTAVWVSKWYGNLDIREHGSRNAGATNVMRVLGPRVGIPVLLFDALKGFLAVSLIHFIDYYYIPKSNDFVSFQLLLGLSSIIGHIFPVFAGFKGGKGVATLLGMAIGILPIISLIVIGIFIITLLITKYVSLSSMIAGFSFPVLLIFVFKTSNLLLIIFSLGVFILLLITHQKNIERLLKHEESKVGFLNRRKRIH